MPSTTIFLLQLPTLQQTSRSPPANGQDLLFQKNLNNNDQYPVASREIYNGKENREAAALLFWVAFPLGSVHFGFYCPTFVSLVGDESNRCDAIHNINHYY